VLRKALVVSALLLVTIAAFADAPQKANRIVIKKNAHELALYRGDVLMKTYKVAIGPGGQGFKHREGDRVTPVGHYHVIMHQPSQFHQFLRLDYPNAEDFRRFNEAKARGELPKTARIGGDIGIHGPPVTVPSVAKPFLKLRDWTAGCIALNDDEISEVASLVRDGTPVDIED